MATLIGIGGVARAGKDTLYSFLEEYFLIHGIITKRISLADNLKKELDPILIQNFGISAFTQDIAEKTLIRQIFVFWAEIRRQKTQGTYWTGLVQDAVNDATKAGWLPVITDIRFDTFEEDEVNWLKKQGGLLIHIQRLDKDGNLVKPASELEVINDPKVQAKADYNLVFPTIEDRDKLRRLVLYELDKIFNA